MLHPQFRSKPNLNLFRKLPMSFDPQSFLDASISTSLDTKVIPVPVGEYAGVIEKIQPRQWTSGDGSKSGMALDIFWIVEDEAVKAELGRETVICKQGLMLDTTPQGALDVSKGKNVDLGRLRDALGMNEEGQLFSFNMLPGRAAKINVKHRSAPNGDLFAEVKGVARL